MLFIIGFLILLVLLLIYIIFNVIDQRDMAIEQSRVMEQREGYYDAIQ